MPIVSIAEASFKISDYENEVIKRTENRTNDVARARVWLKEALIEISGNPDFRNEFDELEVLGPTFNLTANTQEYDFANLIDQTNPDINLGTLDVLIWLDIPAGQRRRKLRMTSYQEADKFQPLVAIPNAWYRFSNTIGFVPIPNGAYQVQARYLRQHPLVENAVQGTVILLPRDWHDILIWAAVERGFMELLEYEKAGAIHTLLHGDPKYPTRIGLINSRKKRREREDWRMEKGLRPIIRRYGWGA